MKNMFDEMLNYCYVSVLKPLGWKKEGSNFRLYCDDGLCKIINFQKSRWNTSQVCEFYINMGIYIEKASKIENKKFYEYECQVRNRTSSERGVYRLDYTLDLENVQKHIAKIINDEALLFFNNFDSKEKFLIMLLSGDAQRYSDTVVMNYHTCRSLSEMGYKKEIFEIVKDKKGEFFEGLTSEIQKEIDEGIVV